VIPRIAAAVAVAAALALAITVRPPHALPAFSQAATTSALTSYSGRHGERRSREAAPKSNRRRHHARGYQSRAHGKRSTRGHRAPIHVVDVNHAGVNALAAVPGVGEELARRIVTYRALVGRFDSLDDLSDLDGLSESRLISLGRYLVVR